MKIKLFAICGLVSVLGACASTPKEDMAQLPVPKEAPKVFEDPVDTGPVTPPAVIQDATPPPYTGPNPGTVDHFKYVSGEDRVYFGYDRYDLSPQSRDVLRRQADWLKTYENAILVIGGNADERGTREYNLALGARRANAVKDFLISQGISPSRMTTVSYGKERPIDGRSTEAAWAKNRNAHSSVLVGGTS